MPSNPFVDDEAEGDDDIDNEDEDNEGEDMSDESEDEFDLADSDAGAELVEELTEELRRTDHQALLHQQRMDAEDHYNFTNDQTLNRVLNDLDDFEN